MKCKLLLIQENNMTHTTMFDDVSDKSFLKRKNASKTFTGGLVIGVATGILMGSMMTLSYILAMIS